MRRAAFALAMAITLVLALSPTAARAKTFRIDSARSALIVQVFKDGPAARLAHDHVVEATEFSGTVEYDPNAPDASVITVEARMDSLTVDDPATRRKFGLSGEPSTDERADIQRTMRSEGQLDIARFPSVRFASTQISRQPDGRLLVAGKLTIRGVTQDVSFPAQVSLEESALRGRATLTFNQSSFGYKPYSAVLGAIKNKDAVMLHVDLRATP